MSGSPHVCGVPDGESYLQPAGSIAKIVRAREIMSTSSTLEHVTWVFKPTHQRPFLGRRNRLPIGRGQCLE